MTNVLSHASGVSGATAILTISHNALTTGIKVIWDCLLPSDKVANATYFEPRIAKAAARVLARNYHIGYDIDDEVCDPHNSGFILSVADAETFVSTDTDDALFYEMDSAYLIMPEVAYFIPGATDWSLSPCNVFAIEKELDSVSDAMTGAIDRALNIINLD